MRFAYADPPYLGCGQSHYGEHRRRARRHNQRQEEQVNPDDVLTEWERLAQEATEGPWDHEPWGGENQNGDLSGGNVFDGDGEYLVSEMSDADGAFIAAARTAWPAATAALRAVLDLHRPTNDDGAVYCGWSTERGIWNGCGQAWPCTTVRRITEALGGQG